MSLRRLYQEGAALLRRHPQTLDVPSELLSAGKRAFSSLPEDISLAARRAKFPPRRHVPPEAVAAPAAEEAASVDMVKEGARIASSWMFPWERRQMEGGSLRTWEKLYWGVFVVAISIFLFNRARDWKEEEPEVDETIEQRKVEKARMVLAGGSVIDGEEDPFEGLSPEEVAKFVEKSTGASAADPFEGMDPEEIDAWVKEHGMAGR